MAGKLILCRHGQSDWNLKNLFTGWQDVDLTEKGIQEGIDAGRLLSELGFDFDVAYTSVLKRAIRTLWHMLDQMDLMWIPVIRDWRTSGAAATISRRHPWPMMTSVTRLSTRVTKGLPICPARNRSSLRWNV